MVTDNMAYGILRLASLASMNGYKYEWSDHERECKGCQEPGVFGM